MSEQPNVITPERLQAIEDEAHRAMQRAWDAGHAADGTVPMLCAALRVAWQERDARQAKYLAAWELIHALDRMVEQIITAEGIRTARELARTMRAAIDATRQVNP
jgi:hypothetical protein